MNKLIEIQNVYDAEVELITKQSELLLQRNGGLNGELKTAGSIVENYVKGLLQKHIPFGYRICSGYIATTDTINETKNLIQHDIIIVDDRIPSLYKFGFGDIEIVAAESVCGIIEVKRTLDRRSLTSAIKHLGQTKAILDKYDGGVKSKNKQPKDYQPHSDVKSAIEAPIYAIIGIKAAKVITKPEFIDEVIEPAMESFIDLIWSPGAPYAIFLQWKVNGEFCLANHVSRFENGFTCKYGSEGFDKKGFNKEKRGVVFRGAISTLRTWIANSRGSTLSAKNNYKYFGMTK